MKIEQVYVDRDGLVVIGLATVWKSSKILLSRVNHQNGDRKALLQIALNLLQ